MQLQKSGVVEMKCRPESKYVSLKDMGMCEYFLDIIATIQGVPFWLLKIIFFEKLFWSR